MAEERVLSISEAYEKFAVETYSKVHQELSRAISENEGSILLLSMEEHMDSQEESYTNGFTHVKDQEPAISAAYTHISALKSAVDIAGSENVVLSIELPVSVLSQAIAILKENEGKIPGKFAEAPHMYAVAFALEKGIKIMPTDPLSNQNMSSEREQMMADSVGSIVTDENPPRVVVHIGGAMHLSTFQGYSAEEVIQSQGSITASSDRNPYKGIYDDVLYFNNARSPQRLLEFIENRNSNGDQYTLYSHEYFTNPDNAIQIDAPGMAFYDDKYNVRENVEEAAQKLGSSENKIERSLTTQPNF